MEVFIVISIFVIGMIFGSFFNVVGYRLPNEMSLIFPGSHCTKCNKKLSWYELIPVFSYLFQRGKCRKCGEKISILYPVVETLTGILFVISYLVFGFTSNFVISLLLSSFLVIVIVSDINYLIIPDEVTLVIAILIGIVRLVSDGLLKTSEYILCGVILFLIMYLIMRIGNYMFKKESLGGGDIKLMFVTGLVIGIEKGLFSIFLASLLALVPSVIASYKSNEGAVPFGPFLIVAALIMYMTNFDIMTIFNFFG